MLLGNLLALALVGCGPSIVCDADETPLAERDGRTLTCGEAGDVADYIHLLAGRGASGLERERLTRDLVSRFEADPEATEAWIAALVTEGRALEGMNGTPGAEEKARRVWAANAEQGLIRPEHGMAWTAQDSALSVWATHDGDKLALTEMDIEAWLRYASLCREVQGGGPLRLSVADRVTVYAMVVERFTTGRTEDRVALVALGPYWGQIHEGWQMASYERQQAWINAAPLPPPMTASSLGYTEAVLQGNLVEHAWTLHERIGPFNMSKGGPAFEPPTR